MNYCSGIVRAAAGIALVLCAASLAAENVRIRRIRLLINQTEYSWDDAGSCPRSPESGETSPGALIAFLDLQPGMSLSSEDLEARCVAAKNRLLGSGYFAAVRVAVLPARKDPAERTVIVHVTDSFRLRFSFSPFYGMYGTVNDNGGRVDWTAILGYNRTGFSVVDWGRGINPFTWRGGLLYTNSSPGLIDQDFTWHRGRFEVGLGKFLNPDLHAELYTRFDGMLLFSEILDFESPWWGGSQRLSFGIGSIMSYSASLQTGLIGLEVKAEGEAGALVNLTGIFECRVVPIASGVFSVKAELNEHTLGLQLSAGKAWGNLPRFLRFNLGDTPDRSLRNGLPLDSLFLTSFILTNAEYRWRFLSFTIPPVFPASIEGFVFMDLALLPEADGSSFAAHFSEAFGGGIRLHFDMPVFVSLTFAFGTDSSGLGHFIFTVTGGF